MNRLIACGFLGRARREGWFTATADLNVEAPAAGVEWKSFSGTSDDLDEPVRQRKPRGRTLKQPTEVLSLSPRGTSGERVGPSSAVALLRRVDSTATEDGGAGYSIKLASSPRPSAPPGRRGRRPPPTVWWFDQNAPKAQSRRGSRLSLCNAALSTPFHKYDHVCGEGFLAQTRRERRAYPSAVCKE